MKNEIEIEFLSSGYIRFGRGPEEKLFLLNLLSCTINDDQKKEIEVFLNESDKREILLGEEILCG